MWTQMSTAAAIVPLVLAAAGAFLASPPGSVGDPTLPEPAPMEYGGFTFAAGSCESGQPDCPRSMPKEWASSEIDVVKNAIDEIRSRPDGIGVVDRTERRGVTVLGRYGVFMGRSGAVPAAAALRRDRMPVAIELYDSFFASPGGRDAYSGKPGFLLVSAILLHECMHAIDDLSREAEFLKVAGFIRRGDRWHFAIKTGDEAAALTRFNDEFARYEAKRDFMGEWRLGRDTAMNMRPIRAPTIQATVRPTEAFAEIGAILILDPNARGYLPRDLVAYFDRNVFFRSPVR